MKCTQCKSFCGKYYAWISLASNLFNAIFKISVGILAHSQTLVADGFHSLSDGATSLTTAITLRISSRPIDEHHPYGHGKIEFLSALVFSLLLIALGLVIITRAVISICAGTVREPNFLAIGPAAVSILINVVISSYGICVGREINSPVITANAKENRADALSSVASLAGIVGALLGYPFLDPLAAIVVSLLIGHMGIRILQDSSRGLMDASLPLKDRTEIFKIVSTVPGVEAIRFLKTRRLGQRIWVDTGIAVSADLPLREGDVIAQEVRNALLRNLPLLENSHVYLEPEEPRGFLRSLWEKTFRVIAS